MKTQNLRCCLASLLKKPKFDKWTKCFQKLYFHLSVFSKFCVSTQIKCNDNVICIVKLGEKVNFRRFWQRISLE